MGAKDADDIKKFVQRRYGEIARQTPSCCPLQSEEAATCCSPGAEQTAYARRLYSQEELDALSQSITSLGCGNPVALAQLKAGEVVLDLGSGAGLDCFLAAHTVGAEGKVIGLDMTPEMVQLARANAKRLSLGNVEFRLGEVEHLPIESNSVDVVISNCVINLSPDKDAAFSEAFRVLKPGGRMCVSDIVTRGELAPEVRHSLELWAACVAGALEEKVYLEKIRAAGFIEVSLEGKNPPGEGIASITVTAYKPR